MKGKTKKLFGILFALVILAVLLPMGSAAEAAAGDVAINAANFPDEGFRNFVNTQFNKNRDGVLSESERNAVTFMNVSDIALSSLKGVEHFPALEILRCEDRLLTSLDVSANTALKELFCQGNQLTSLDVTRAPLMQEAVLHGSKYVRTDYIEYTCAYNILRVSPTTTVNAGYSLQDVNVTTTGINPSSYDLQNMTYSLKWRNDNAPVDDKLGAGITSLCTNQACTNKFYGMPEFGKKYYVQVYFTNTVAGDRSIDFSHVSNSSCKLDIPGMAARCISVESSVNAVDHSTLAITFEVNRAYRLSSFDAVATGLWKDINGNYALQYQIPNGTHYSWEGVVPSSDDYAINSGRLASDEGGSMYLTNEPMYGETCYIKIQVYAKEMGDTYFNFSNIKKENCTLTLPGYYAECVQAAKADPGPGVRNTLTMIFKLERRYEYTLLGTKVTATGIGAFGYGDSSRILIGHSIKETWFDKVPTAVDYAPPNYIHIYTDKECTTQLKTDPVAGGTYYARVSYASARGLHNIDFTNIVGSSCSLTIDGYECAYVKTNVYFNPGLNGSDGANIVFRLTKLHTITELRLSATQIFASPKDNHGILEGIKVESTAWGGDSGTSVRLGVTAVSVYTDYDFTKVFYGDTVVDGEYYVKLTASAANTNFSKLKENPLNFCSMTVPGYRVQCFNIKGNDNGPVELFFQLKKVADYAVRSVTVSAPGATQYFRPPHNIYLTDPVEKTVRWASGKNPGETEYTISVSRLTSDSAGLNRLTAYPNPGDVSYVRVTVTQQSSSSASIDFSHIIESECKLTVPGYKVEFYRAITSASKMVQIDFKLMKLYVLKKVNATAAGVEKLARDYALQDGNLGPSWENSAKPNPNQWYYSQFWLYTDESCTNFLKTEPQEGVYYYTRVSIVAFQSYVQEHIVPCSIDFHQLAKENCTLTVPGYTAECYKITAADYPAVEDDEVNIVFRIAKNSGGTPLGVSATAVVALDKDGDYYRLENCTSNLTWKNGKVATHYKVTGAAVYTDAVRTNMLTTSPVKGTPYYATIVMQNTEYDNHDIDFSELSAGSCFLTLPGYTSECVNIVSDTATAYDTRIIVFKIVKISDATDSVQLMTESGGSFEVGKILRSQSMSRTAGKTGEPNTYGYDPDNVSMTLRVLGASTADDAMKAMERATIQRVKQGGSLETLTQDISGSTMTLSYTKSDGVVAVMSVRAYAQGGDAYLEFTSLASGAVRITLDGREYLIATPGDVNLDGTMNALDWITIMRWTLVASGGEYTSPTDEGFTIKVNGTDYNLWVLLADMTDTEPDNSKNSANWNAAVNAVDWITIMQLTLQAWK